ncbi:MAG: arsenate reductase [Candidatus Marinamargulisbacteria bacterium]|jgi:arsenate reductase
MSNKPVYFHNPRCSKSRQGLDLLNRHNFDVTIKEYLNEALTENELKDVVSKLGKRPKAIIRKKESAELGIDFENLDDDACIQKIIEHPKILERPILITSKRAALGRPPEALLDII